MLTIEPDIDLDLLVKHFTETEDYPKEQSLSEIKYWQTQPDFLAIISSEDGQINGFLLACRRHNYLWIHQVWSGTKISVGRDALEEAKMWAKERGMTSVMGEFRRDRFSALKRYGFEEYSVVIKCLI